MTDDGSISTTDTAVRRAAGWELRLIREAKGWSRQEFLKLTPSHIGDRTLMSYECGARNMTLARFVELCRALGVSSASVLTTALQRARLYLEDIHLRIDLRALLRDTTPEFHLVRQWALHKLNRTGTDFVELAPTSVVEIADLLACSTHELATYLATFVPDTHPPAEWLPDGTVDDITMRIIRAAS